VSQADIAALMAYLAGLAFPVNSVGELLSLTFKAILRPRRKRFWSMPKRFLRCTALKKKKKSQKNYVINLSRVWGMRNTLLSTESLKLGSQSITEMQKQHERSNELIKLGLEVMRYLQTYDWFFLRTLVTAGYLGWIAVCNHHCDRPSCFAG